MVLVVKNHPANGGDIRDVGLIKKKKKKETWVRSLGCREPPGEGHGNLLQYSCLENSMDRGVWRAIVHGVTQSQTQLK